MRRFVLQEKDKKIHSKGMDINWDKIKEEYLTLIEQIDANINFLSLLPINENTHTNILATILSNKQNNRYPFIKTL